MALSGLLPSWITPTSWPFLLLSRVLESPSCRYKLDDDTWSLTINALKYLWERKKEKMLRILNPWYPDLHVSFLLLEIDQGWEERGENCLSIVPHYQLC